VFDENIWRSENFSTSGGKARKANLIFSFSVPISLGEFCVFGETVAPAKTQNSPRRTVVKNQPGKLQARIRREVADFCR